MTTSTGSAQLEELSINTIRTLSMDAVQKANSGHPGTAMALAPLAYTLFTRVMRHNPANPDWPDRDRFVLSAGHASMLLYSMLYLTGYPLTLDDIKNFRQVGSPTAGHPGAQVHAGHRGHHRAARPGPLDVGGPGARRAHARRALQPARPRDRRSPHLHDRQRRRHPGGRGLRGVARSPATWGLGRLIAFYDANHIQLASEVDVVMTEDVGARYEAYGWHVHRRGRGPLRRDARARHPRGDGGRGPALADHRALPHRLRQPAAGHLQGARLAARRGERAQGQGVLRLGSRRPVPGARGGARPLPRGAASAAASTSEEWDERFGAYREAQPRARRATFERHGRRPHARGLRRGPAALRGRRGDGHAQGVGQGRSSGRPRPCPQLVGGAADLATSTNTDIEAAGDVQRDHYEGRNLRFGVREHGMGAIVNGLTLHGFRGYGSTFLIFSDYMRGRDPAVGAAGAAVDLGLHARLDRAGRGRAHPPADRAARGAARDAAAEGRPAGRRQRDRARLALRAARRPTRRPRSRCRARTCR